MTERREIEQLETKQDAATLTHYYVDPRIQGMADYIGDSFYLDRIMAGLNRRAVTLCGVSFMGENGKLLGLDKVVLMSDVRTDCLMAHMVAEEKAGQYRREYPDFAMVCYINSTAEIKPWSDMCITSANAVQIMRNLPNRDILFMPSKDLGWYVAGQMPEKHVVPVNSYCLVHDQVFPKEVPALREVHPSTQVLARPECNAQVLELADYIDSTIGTLKFVTGSASREFIICTEDGICHELEQQDPGKHFYSSNTEPACRDMRKITLDKIIYILRAGQDQASVPKAYVSSAGEALRQVLNLTR